MVLPDRRSPTLSEADIAAIAEAVVILQTKNMCECPVDPDELSEAVKFFKNMNDWLDGSKRTIWNTILTLSVAGVCAAFLAGLWMKSGPK